MSKHDHAGGTGGHDAKLSRASVGRYSLYLRHLERLQAEGVSTVSSSQLGDALAITDAQVRKDLAYLGSLGQPGIGYAIAELHGALRHRLGVDRAWNAVLVGAGNLARALLRYRGFQKQGFRFVALFDADPSKIGTTIDGVRVSSTAQMREVIAAEKAELGVIAAPASAAQELADALAAAGIRGILNFAPTLIRIPPGVSLVTVDLAVQLEQLAFLVHGSDDGGP